MRNYILMLFIFSGVLSGCAVVDSSQVQPSAIYAQYSASYDEASNQLEYSATFLVGGELGTYVELNGGSNVTLDGQDLLVDHTIANQVYYALDSAATPASVEISHVFAYTDNTGARWTNSAQVPGIVFSPPAQATTASIAAGFSVLWQTQTPLGSGESVSVDIEGQQGASFEYSSGGGTSGEVSITKADLQSLGTGQASVSICRVSEVSQVNSAGGGGMITQSYCATPFDVTITP